MTSSEDAVVILLQRLADEDPPPDPGRRAAIAGRIGRVRRRRAWTAGLAVLGLMLGAVVLIGRAGGDRVRGDVNAAAAPGGYIPAGTPVSWRAVDGLVYQRLAVVTLDTARQQARTVTISPGAGPVGIVAHCSTGQGTASVTISGAPIATGPAVPPQNRPNDFDCATDPQVWHDFDLSWLPAGQRRISLNFLADIGGTPAVWTFGVYRWGPMGDAPHPLTAPVLPRYLPAPADGRLTLAEVFTGGWPTVTPVQATVSPGDVWEVVVQCAGAIAGQAGFVVHHNLVPPRGSGGSAAGPPVRCGAPGEPVNPVPIELESVGMVLTSLHISIEFSFDPMYDNRLGTWAVGLYRLEP